MDNLLQQAFELRKSHQYKQAIDIYQSLWKENLGQFSQWDGWSYAFCLFKLKNYNRALEVCRMLYPRFKTFDMLRSLYARCIYYTQFTPKAFSDIPILKKAAQAIYDLSPPHTPYSITPKAIFKLAKALMSRPEINWKEIEDWLLKMDPDLLDDQAFKMTDTRGKKMEYASSMEQWYATMIKVKAGLNEPQQLLNILADARKKKIRWHYNNDTWFARKEAFAYQQLGQKEKAESILRNITLQKKDWFLLFDLAQIVPDRKESLQLLCKAALSKGKNEMKLKLYEAIYSNLKDNTEYKYEAILHLCLIAAIREENNWEVKQDLLEKIKNNQINLNAQGSSSRILEELIPFWEKMTGREKDKKQRTEGIIDQMFPKGNAGFIKAGKQSYFFLTKELKGEARVGQKVSFEWIDSFDKKKQKPSKMAVRITIKQ